LTFETRQGKITFAQYYEQKYQIRIQDLRQPLLIAKATARKIRGGKAEQILLVPELCRATGITDEMRTNFGLMQEMSQRTRMSPRDRVDRLRNYNQRLKTSAESRQVYQENLMSIADDLVEFDGRRLKQEIVYFKDSNVDLATHHDGTDWTRLLMKNKMFKSVDLMNWAYVFPPRCEATAQIFIRSFLEVARDLGMQVKKPQEVLLDGDKSYSYTKKLEELARTDLQFIMIILPTKDSFCYSAIKNTTLCRNAPVSVQCVSEQTVKKGMKNLMSIASKIAIQVNCKLSGIPWAVNLKLKGMMLVGFDVSHDSNNRKQSFGAMVAHLNPTGSNNGSYFSAVNNHTDGEQLSRHFGNNICAAIQRYADMNEGNLPERILIYRDGVGDGQVSLNIYISETFYLFS
jgi:aubergine